MAQKTIHVARGFDFTHQDGTVQKFKPGIHRNVPAEVADHWFVAAHLQQDEEAEAVEEKKPEGGNAQQGGNGGQRRK